MKFRLILPLTALLLLFAPLVLSQHRLQPETRLKAAITRGELTVIESALRELERSSPAAFARQDYDYLLARVLARRGASDESRRLLDQVVKRGSPLAAYALWHRAELARAAGRQAEEQQTLSQLISAHPRFLRRETAIMRLGASYLRSRKYQQAITTLRAVAGTRGSRAREALSQIGEAQLALGQTGYARATFDSLLAAGGVDDASLSAIAGLDKLDAAEKRTISETDRVRRASIYQFNRSFADARRHWLALLDEYPQSTHRAEALFQLGRGYFLEYKYEEAIRYYQRAHDEFPITEQGEQGFYYVGHAYQALYDADKAIARYEEFLKAYPRSKYVGYAYLNAIDTLRSAGRMEEALRWAARAGSEVRDPFIRSRALFDAAKIRLTQGNYTGALSDLSALQGRSLGRGLVATTNAAEIAFLRAYCMEKLGRYDEAISAYLAMPEGRDGAAGYYGYRASERLRALAKGTRTERLVAARRDSLLKQARSAQDATEAKTAATQALRLVEERGKREEMLRILRDAYAKLPRYRLPSFDLLPLEEVAGEGSIAKRLIELGLYDEGAAELVARRAPGRGANARNLGYTIAWYCARGDCADRTIKFSEPLLNAIPNDYRLELLPRNLAEIFYPVPFREELLKYATPRQVDPRFVLSIARQESRYDPRVKSAAAARGLLQFISSTSSQIAAQLRLDDFDQSDLYEPKRAILIGSQYMQNLFQEFGTPQAVAAAYNGSEDSVRRWVARARIPEVDRFMIEVAKRETKDYVFNVVNYYRAYQALYPEFK